MSPKIDEGRVVERVMRMGIEHRCGVPLDDLHDLAIKQLKEESKKATSTSVFENLQDWFKAMCESGGLAYAFMYDAGKVLQVFRITSLDGLKLDYWRSTNFPQVSKVS